MREDRDGHIRLSSVQSGYTSESYFINGEGELDVINQDYLGIGALVAHGNCNLLLSVSI